MPQSFFPEDPRPARPFEVAPSARQSFFPPADGEDPLRQTLDRATSTSPDQAARIFKLRLKTGLPAEAIARNVDQVEREASRQDFDAGKFRRESPLLAAWLQEQPENAELAHDDLEPLSALERALRFGTGALAAGPARFSSMAWGAIRAGAEWTGADDVAEFASGATVVAEHLRNRIAGDRRGAGFVEGAIYGGIESLSLTATTLPLAAIGGPAAVIGALGLGAAGEAYTKARREGLSVGGSTLYGGIQGGIEAATELIPMRFLLGDMAKHAGLWQTLAHQVASEIPMEQLATVTQDLTELIALRPEATFVDYLRERPSAAAETLISTIVAVGGQTAIVQGLERATGTPTSQRVLDELHAAAAASKTRERAPEALRAFVDQATQNGLTHVYAPAETFTEYFQTKGEDPEAFAQQLGIEPEAYRLAVATGGDLAIPTSTYVTSPLAAAHVPFFTEELRLQPDQLNARETREAFKEESAAGGAGEVSTDTAAAGRQQVHQAVTEKLAGLNRFTPQEVDAYASLWATIFEALASRQGADPLTLFQRFPGDVTSEGGRPLVMPSAPSLAAQSEAAGAFGALPDIPASTGQPGETGEQRLNRRQAHLQALAGALTPIAQLLDPTVDQAVVLQDLEFRVSLLEEQQAAQRESGRGQDLLRALAGMGGLVVDKSQNDSGELAKLLEDADKRERRDRGKARTWNGVAGVVRTKSDGGGVTIQAALERLRQEPRFEYLEDDIDGLWTAIDEAIHAAPDVDALPGTAELKSLGITPTERWWMSAEDVDAGETVFENGDAVDEFEQADPVAVLNGTELGVEADAPLTELRAAAIAYYRRELQQTTVDREGFGVVLFTGTGRGKLRSFSADPNKLRLVPAIRSIIERGTYLGREQRYKPRRDSVVAFHRFMGAVQLGERTLHARVIVTEDVQGNKFYDLDSVRDSTPGSRHAQKTDLGPEDGGTILEQSMSAGAGDVNIDILEQGDQWNTARGTFNPETRLIRLLANANRSTFIHESAHFFLEVMSELAQAPDAPAPLQADMQTLLEWVGFDGDLAAWRGLTHADRRQHHEQFARGFEKYLAEGKAPTSELQPLFARFRAWLLGVYRSLRNLRVDLTDDVRKVMDRLVATDAAIAAAESDAQIAALFTDAAAAGVSETEFTGYRDQVEAASEAARDRLQQRLMRELAREQEAWWNELREVMRAQVAAEVEQQPVYRALAGMRGELEGQAPTPLARDFLVAQFGKDILKQLPKPWVYSKNSGLPPDTVAQLYGFSSGEQLIEAVVAAAPMDKLIDQLTDDRLYEEVGTLLKSPQELAEQARQAIADEHRDRVVRTEIRMLNKLVAAAAPSVRAERQDQRDRARAGEERLRAELPDEATLQRLAKEQIASMPLREIRPDRFFAVARRASRDATAAAATQRFDKALEAKGKELLNLALYREALAAREAVEEARQAFDAMFKPDGPMAKRRNMDFVQAARAIAAKYFWPERRLQKAADSLELIRKHTEDDVYEVLAERIRAATAAGDDLQSLTFEAFQVMRETVDSLWELSARDQQMLIDGQLIDRSEVANALDSRLEELGAPASQFDRTDTERKLSILGFRAALRRVEHWVDYVDGGNALGAFRRFIWNPISEATAQYRIQRGVYLQKFLELLKPVEPTLVAGKIPAPELGYVFESKAALLHALAHSGNESNFQKLVRGYRWGQLKDDGTVDDSRWRRFLDRAHQTGLVTKADWDFVQSLWDLNEELKGQAQKAHREMYGHYFSEITAWPVETPFGTYRGGYVPALVDPVRVAKQEAYSEKSLTDGDNAHMFPTTGRGFTKARMEAYARPLALNLKLMPGHLDKVLRFVHIEPRVRDVGRLLRTHRVREAIDAYDPEAINEMLVPWLQRAATQRVAKVPSGRTARAVDSIFRTLRTRTGLNMMAGHVINTLQQFTGLSVAAVKVPPRYLRNALWRYVREHKATVAFVDESSDFMKTRMTAATIEIQRTIDDLLLNPSAYEQVRDFATKHGYFLQGATQGMVDVITWSGAYEQATEQGVDHGEAVRRADSAVRETQGSFAPEDASRVESQTSFVRVFVMFYGYFNTLANLNGNELAMVARDLGLRRGAGRALYVYTFGFLLTAVMSEAILRTLSGGWDDEDDDGYLDEVMSLFFGSQLRQVVALAPGGQAAAAVLNHFNDKAYDDRVSTSPAITMLDSASRAPKSVYQAIVEDGPKKRAVRDALAAIGLLSGLPVGAIARPAGYLADVADGSEDADGGVDLARGLVSGRSQEAGR